MTRPIVSALRGWLLVGLIFFVGSLTLAEELRPPVSSGLRVATCGHSFHVFTYRQVSQIAQAAGLQHRLVGLSSIGGSTVQRHWDVATDKSLVKQVLESGNVDVLTLSPIWLPDDGIEKFVRLGLEHNPELRITVQEYWMPNDEYEPVYPLQTRKQVDHNATDLSQLRQATQRYADDIETHVREINRRIGKDAVLVVPVGLAGVALREKIVKGEAPGLERQSDLFRDNWGHAQLPLQFLASYCHYSVLYRRSPMGLPVPAGLQQVEHISDADKASLNKLLQQLAWETVSCHPMTGIRQ